MNQTDAARFEAQAAETVGAMKELFGEFERRLGEVVAAHRLAASEARTEGVKTLAALEGIARQARALTESQRQAIDELRNGWRLHVAENSKAAGAEMARAFGHEIAGGLEQRLGKLGDAVDRVTRRFQQITLWKLVGGIALGMVLIVGIGVYALVPSVEGLSNSQLREAMARIALCQVGQEAHVCAAVDDKPLIGRGANGKALLVLKGM